MTNVKFKVFISSTALDLAEYRKCVNDVIEQLQMDPIHMGKFEPSANNALQTCYNKIYEAHVLVGIYAHRYGYIPDNTATYVDKSGNIHNGDGITSITHWEYLWALERKIPLLLFIIDENALWKIQHVDDGESKRFLEEFKQHILSKHTISFFMTLDQFSKDITKYLGKVKDELYDKYLNSYIINNLPIRDQIFPQLNDPPARPPQSLTREIFFNRRLEIQKIIEFINKRYSLVCIYGLPGIGKTALISHISKAHVERDSNLIGAYLEFNDKGFIDSIINYVGYLFLQPSHKSFIDELNLTINDKIAFLKKSLLDLRKRLILCIDNFENAQDPKTGFLINEDVKEFFEIITSSLCDDLITVIIASQYYVRINPQNQANIRVIELKHGFSEPDGIEYMRSLDTVNRLPNDEELKRWIRRLDGHPIGLKMLVGYLAGDIMNNLKDLENADNLAEKVLKFMIDQTYLSQLDIFQYILLVLTVSDTGLTLTELEYVLSPFLNLNKGELRVFLGRLAERYLVIIDFEHEIYNLSHPILLEYFRYYLPAKDETPNKLFLHRWKINSEESLSFNRHTLLNRLAEYHKQRRKPENAWEKTSDIEPQLSEMRYRFENGDFNSTAMILLNIDFNYLLPHGDIRIALDWYTRLDGKKIYKQLETQIIHNWGYAYYLMNDANLAIQKYNIALRMVQSQHDKRHEAIILNNLGTASLQLGKITKAIRYYELALDIARLLRDKQLEGSVVGNLAVCYFDLGKITDAVKFIRNSIRIDNNQGDLLNKCRHLVNLGHAFIVAGKHHGAIRFLKDANKIVDLGKKNKPIQLLHDLFGYLARSYWFLGDSRNALENILKARKYTLPLSNHWVISLHGCISFCSNQQQEAYAIFQEAIESIEYLLEKSPHQYDVLYSRALVLAGLWVITQEEPYLNESSKAYEYAKSVFGYTGVLMRERQVLEKLLEFANVDGHVLLAILT